MKFNFVFYKYTSQKCLGIKSIWEFICEWCLETPDVYIHALMLLKQSNFMKFARNKTNTTKSYFGLHLSLPPRRHSFKGSFHLAATTNLNCLFIQISVSAIDCWNDLPPPVKKYVNLCIRSRASVKHGCLIGWMKFFSDQRMTRKNIIGNLVKTTTKKFKWVERKLKK